MSFSSFWILSQQKTYCKTCNKQVSEGILGALGDYVICEDCLDIEKQKMKAEEKEEKSWFSWIFDSVFGEDKPAERPNGSNV
jgi:hypothetical protein